MNFDELIPDQLKHHLSPSGTYDADLPGSAAPNVLFWSAFLINIEISKGLISASAAESAINDTDSFAKHLGVGISLNGGRGRGGRGGRLSISVPCIFWSEAQLSPETVRSDVNLRLQAARMSAWCRKYLPDLPSDISDVDFILENTAKLAEESSDTDKGEDESCTACKSRRCERGRSLQNASLIVLYSKQPVRRERRSRGKIPNAEGGITSSLAFLYKSARRPRSYGLRYASVSQS